jgi:hypothetical protein
MVAAIGLVAAVAVGRSALAKIGNPSPPPPGQGTDMAGDQGKPAPIGATARGDVDHVQVADSGAYIPPEDPDIIHPTKVGWYEDDPSRPGRTHIHWVPRAEWEAAADFEPEIPRWRRVLGL